MRALPTPRILLATRSRKWTVSEALFELLDNAFDEDSGNAPSVHITWSKKNRAMAILDDGRGMDDIADLFTLGKGREHGERGISMYGVGGSEALLWLSDKVMLYTLRDGMVSYDTINWKTSIKRNEFPDVNNVWKKATPSNTPAELFAQRQGTLIAFAIRNEHSIIDGAEHHPVQREIARTYAAGLRSGKRITWNEDTLQPYEPGTLTDIREFDVEVQGLPAHVLVGRCDGVAVDNYKFTVNFGYRRVEDTKEPFGKYSGIKAVGRIDLGMEWKKFLATTKNGFTDDVVRAELMTAVRDALADFFEELAAERMESLLADIALSLEQELGGMFAVEAKGRGKDRTPRKKRVVVEGPEEAPTPAPEPKHDELGRTRILLNFDGEVGLPDRLVRVDIREGAPILATLNDEQVVVKTALEAKPVNRMLLSYMVVSEMAKELSSERSLLVKMKLYKASELTALQDDNNLNGEDKEYIPYITRKLFNKVGVEA